MIKLSSRSKDPCYQDIRLEVGESMTFRSDNIDPNCRFCKQVKITMLNFQESSSGFEYNYTMRIGGHKYSGDI